MRLICIASILVFATIGVAKEQPLTVPGQDISTEYGTLHVSELMLTHEGDHWSLSGGVMNNTDRNWRYLQFNLNLWGKRGNPISIEVATSPEIKDIKRSETKSFTGLLDEPYSIDSFMLREKPSRFALEFDPSRSYFDSKYVFALTNPKQNSELRYVDESLEFSFTVSNDEINFTVKNNTNSPASINWDKASFIDLDSNSHRVFHKDVRIVERDKPQADTVIPPTAKWDDLIAPVDYVSWNELIHDWSRRPLLPPSQSAPLFKGKSFGVFLPVEVNGKQKNYLFTIQIADVII